MSENLFYDMLSESHRDRRLVCIFRDPSDLRRFAVGYVVAVSPNDYSLQQIDPDGRADGLDIGSIDDIIEIRRESRYARQILLLMENQEIEAEGLDNSGAWKGSPNPESCLEDVLRLALADKMVVNILLTTGDDELRFYGLVREVTPTHIKIDVLTDDGEPDGTSAIRIDEIAGLQVNTRDERRVALLHRHRMHLYL
ncbi:MAG: hypothetical protein LBU79_09065 [Planctomycetota bacterium]|jgi:hypothetical protein|nr:hypothetical protein [Planctomycetota bacterium]